MREAEMPAYVVDYSHAVLAYIEHDLLGDEDVRVLRLNGLSEVSIREVFEDHRDVGGMQFYRFLCHSPLAVLDEASYLLLNRLVEEASLVRDGRHIEPVVCTTDYGFVLFTKPEESKWEWWRESQAFLFRRLHEVLKLEIVPKSNFPIQRRESEGEVHSDNPNHWSELK